MKSFDSDGLKRAGAFVGERVYNCAMIAKILDYVAFHDSEGSTRYLPEVIVAETTIFNAARRNGFGVNVRGKGFTGSNGMEYGFLIRESELPGLLELLGVTEVKVQEVIGAADKVPYRKYRKAAAS